MQVGLRPLRAKSPRPMNETAAQDAPASVSSQQKATDTVFALLFAISFSHLLNDTIQALLPAIYPVLKESYGLTFTQLGLITLTFQCTASLLQPLVGYITDKRPMPYSLPVGMGMTLIGLLLLSQAHSFPMILISSALVGAGSAVFHPEASRIAHMAAGKRRGLAQSLFQVGEMQAPPSARCWPLGSLCRMGRARSPGSPSSPCSACWCCFKSAAGRRKTCTASTADAQPRRVPHMKARPPGVWPLPWPCSCC